MYEMAVRNIVAIVEKQQKSYTET